MRPLRRPWPVPERFLGMTPSDLAYEHNGARIDRAAFYAIACDPRRSVAVEACAGAGKTWMLVSRILRALLEGAQPHEILAITFTKKAAGEMRQRLQEWLVEFAQAPPEKRVAELVVRGIAPASAQALVLPLAQLFTTVLDTGRPVQVRTFHSWFAALLRTAPVAVLQGLGLSVHYQLLEDDSEAVQAVWPRFQTGVAQDAVARTDYLAAVAAHGRSQTHKALQAALAKRVEFGLADAAGVVDASVQPFSMLFSEWAMCSHPNDLLQGDAEAEPLRTLWRAAGALGQAGQRSFADKGAELEQALTGRNADAVLAALLTQKNEARKFSDKLAGIEAIRAAQAVALRWLAALSQHAAWEHQQRMARLTRRLVADYAQLKRERGWVDMNDLESAALAMLRDDVLSGWVQERLDARVKHLLIDEFQDTNPLQWQALKAWLSGYAGAGGGQGLTVFIVGDPKQSIYRFRRAEPQVFRAAQAFVRQELAGELLSCDHTHRNAPAVLAAVNGVMGAAHGAGDYPGYRDHTTESTATGSVARLPQIARATTGEASGEGRPEDADGVAWRNSLTTPRQLPEDTLRSRECRQAAHVIAAELAAGRQPRDIMVLARKRAPLGVMGDALRALHIPSQQPEKNDLADAPEVQDLVALLDVLVSPMHDLSLAQVLKSPVFGVSDAALVQLALRQRRATAEGRRVGWLALLQEAPWPEPPLGDATRNIGEALLRWQHWVNTLPPHDALDAICHDGDVFARYAAASPAALRTRVVANLRALLAAALQVDGGRFLTPYALVRALKAGSTRAPAMASTNAVRLLTVHGAKGLEAPVVLLLDTDAAPAPAETMGVLVDWPGEAEAPERFTFLAREKQPPLCNAAALQAEQLARQREELNTLYVAMTRARQTLVMSSIEPHRAGGHSWWQRLGVWAEAHPGACEAFPDPGPPPGLDNGPDALPTPFLMPNLPQALVKSGDLAINNIVSVGPEDDLSARLGQAMHRLLEWGLPAAGEAGVAQLLSVAREFSLSPAQAQEAALLAQRIHTGEGAWAWQADAVDWQGNEVELNHQGQSLRLDRLVRRRDTGAWWVLDYKSAPQPERQPGLLAQMQRYLAAVRAAYPGAPVQAAFLTGDGRLVVAS